MLFREHGKRATPLPNKASVVARRISGSSPPPDKLVSATSRPIAALYASIFYLKFIATESSCSDPEISSLDCSFDRSFIATVFSMQIGLRGVTRFPVAPSLLPMFQFPVNMQRPAQNCPDPRPINTLSSFPTFTLSSISFRYRFRMSSRAGSHRAL